MAVYSLLTSVLLEGDTAVTAPAGLKSMKDERNPTPVHFSGFLYLRERRYDIKKLIY